MDRQRTVSFFLAGSPISHVATRVSSQKEAGSYLAVNEDDKLEKPLSLLLGPRHEADCRIQSADPPVSTPSSPTTILTHPLGRSLEPKV